MIGSFKTGIHDWTVYLETERNDLEALDNDEVLEGEIYDSDDPRRSCCLSFEVEGDLDRVEVETSSLGYNIKLSQENYEVLKEKKSGEVRLPALSPGAFDNNKVHFGIVGEAEPGAPHYFLNGYRQRTQEELDEAYSDI